MEFIFEPICIISMDAEEKVNPAAEIASLRTQLLRLEERIDKTNSILTTLAEELSLLRSELYPRGNVPINYLLSLISKGLDLPQTRSLYVSRGQIQYAETQAIRRNIHLRVYTRRHQYNGGGFTVRHFILIHILINYVTAESSESQNATSLLILLIS